MLLMLLLVLRLIHRRLHLDHLGHGGGGRGGGSGEGGRVRSGGGGGGGVDADAAVAGGEPLAAAARHAPLIRAQTALKCFPSSFIDLQLKYYRIFDSIIKLYGTFNFILNLSTILFDWCNFL